MLLHRFLPSAFAPLLVALAASPACAQTVLVKPYIQPGDGVSLEGADVKVISWVTDQTPGEFTVEYGPKGALGGTAKPERVKLDFGVAKTAAPAAKAESSAKPEAKKTADAPTTLEEFKAKTMAESSPTIPEKEQHFFTYTAKLGGLPFNAEIFYRVKLGPKVIRESSFKTRATADRAVRFVTVGDLASGKPEQNGIAFEIGRAKPDFMVGLGDIVYSAGRVSQYMHHFWPVYNDVDTPSATAGSPILQSVTFYPVIGNHDATSAKLPDVPDAFGAYYFFHGPQNGPGVGAWNLPLGKDAKVAGEFREKVGATYPALNVYSFDNGPAHFVALDSNNYTKEPSEDAFEQLRPWLERDLRASKAKWKFVCFHSPAFHTSKEHFVEQKMRLLVPLFEETGVDIVFAGHVHNYQRSKPLHFTPNPPVRDPRGRVNGDFKMDEKFDGVTNTRPDGVIHIVSGGGGARLYSVDFEKTVEQLKQDNPGNWVPFTAKYVADRHSFSLVELTPGQLTLKQIDINGAEIDRMVITKP